MTLYTQARKHWQSAESTKPDSKGPKRAFERASGIRGPDVGAWSRSTPSILVAFISPRPQWAMLYTDWWQFANNWQSTNLCCFLFSTSSLILLCYVDLMRWQVHWKAMPWCYKLESNAMQMHSQCNALVFWQGGLLYSVTCMVQNHFLHKWCTA